MLSSPSSRPSPVTLHRSATLSDVAEYAYASTVPAGAHMAFLAGSCPLDADGRTVAVGDIAGQARRCVDNLETVLRELGADLHHVASTRVLVASSRQQDLVTAWEVVRDRFGEHDAPSTLVGVAALGYDDQLVEVESTAVLPET
ncbi:RidA family protein [Nesterenkonia suensis]